VRDAVDADVLTTISADRGRRSRVVLTPRRWRQVSLQRSCLLPPSVGGRLQVNAPGEYNVSVPDVVQVNFVPAQLQYPFIENVNSEIDLS
jgi:hypothetical protein